MCSKGLVNVDERCFHHDATEAFAFVIGQSRRQLTGDGRAQRLAPDVNFSSSVGRPMEKIVESSSVSDQTFFRRFARRVAEAAIIHRENVEFQFVAQLLTHSPPIEQRAAAESIVLLVES